MPRREFANEAAVMAASFPRYRDECVHGAPHSSNPIAGPVMELCMGIFVVTATIREESRDDLVGNLCRRYPAVAADPRAAQILISQWTRRDRKYSTADHLLRAAHFLESFRQSGRRRRRHHHHHMPRREFDDEAAVRVATFPQYRKNCMHGASDPRRNKAITEPVGELCLQLGTIGMELGAAPQRLILDVFCRHYPEAASHADAAQIFIAQGVDAFREKDYAEADMFCHAALFLDSFRHDGPQFLDEMDSYNNNTFPGRIPPVSVIRYLAWEIKHCSDVKAMLAFLRERAVCHCRD